MEQKVKDCKESKQKIKSVDRKLIWWKIDPGAIGFTRGFSRDRDYYGG